MLAEKLSGSGAVAKTYIEDVFSTYLYTGNGSTQTLTDNIDRTLGALDIFKGRSGATDWAWYDTVRGVQKDLTSTSTAAQTTQAQGVTAVSSTGVSIGTLAKINTASATYLKATFRKAPKFFDVVSGTADASGNVSFSHALGIAPGAVFIKRTDNVSDWYVYHRSVGSNATLVLNASLAQQTVANIYSVTSTTVTANVGFAPSTGATYVAYLFAHDTSTDGLIQCGSFTDASSGTNVTLGWEPQFLLLKGSSTTDAWHLYDTMRGMSNTNDYELQPNTSGAEAAVGSGLVVPTATGFKTTGTLNLNGSTYIYLAIRRGPMRKPTSGTQVYNAIARTGTGAAATLTGVGFPVDAVFTRNRASGWYTYLSDRLRGATQMPTGATDAEAAQSIAFDTQDGIRWTAAGGGFNNSATSYIDHYLRRYPGVFDQVCYSGTGTTTTVAHNLQSVPEFAIFKSRDAIDDWMVVAKRNDGNYVYELIGTPFGLNTTNAASTSGPASNWGLTSTAFGIYNGARNNVSGKKYVAYLFASLQGISKCGSYTGNGTSQTIDCGFAAGARFVLIKRTDSTGDWYVWDSTRGIVAANDPHLSLNTTAAEVTTDDSVDPVASGFAVNQLAATNINVNGATYIFLALA